MQKFLVILFLSLTVATISLPLLAQEKADEGVIFAYGRIAPFNVIKNEVLPLLKALDIGEKQLKEGVGEYEQSFPFIGKEGANWDKPMGVFFAYGEGYSDKQMVLLALPVKDGFGKIEQFDKDKKTKKVKGFANARLVEGNYVIRISGYFLFSANPKVLTLEKDPMWQIFQADTSLCSFYMDGRKLQERYPGAVEEFFKQVAEKQMEREGMAEDPAAQFGQEIAMEAIKALGRAKIELALVKSLKSLQLKFSSEFAETLQLKLGTAKGLPKSLLFHLYLNSTQWLAQEFLPVIIEAVKKEAPLEEEDINAIIGIVEKLCQASSTVSIGVHYEAKQGTFYIVKENPKEKNEDTVLIRELLDKVNAIAKNGEESELNFQDLDSAKMGRMAPSVPGILIPSPQGDGNIAIFQVGNYTYIVGTNSNAESLYKSIKKLEGDLLTPPLGSLLHVRVNIGGIAKEAASKMDPDLRKLAKDIPKDANITLDVSISGKKLEGSLSIPLSLFPQKTK